MTTRKIANSGFTVIEVLIVLSIAAVILFIVFLAVPAAQRSKRNYERRSDATAVLNLISEERSRTRSFPTSCNNGVSGCFLSNAKLDFYGDQPSGTKTASFYNLGNTRWPGTPPDPNLDPNNHTPQTDRFGTHFDDTNLLSIRSYAKCNSDGTFTGTGAKPDSLALQYAYETTTGMALTCIEQ